MSLTAAAVAAATATPRSRQWLVLSGCRGSAAAPFRVKAELALLLCLSSQSPPCGAGLQSDRRRCSSSTSRRTAGSSSWCNLVTGRASRFIISSSSSTCSNGRNTSICSRNSSSSSSISSRRRSLLLPKRGLHPILEGYGIFQDRPACCFVPLTLHSPFSRDRSHVGTGTAAAATQAEVSAGLLVAAAAESAGLAAEAAEATSPESPPAAMAPVIGRPFEHTVGVAAARRQERLQQASQQAVQQRAKQRLDSFLAAAEADVSRAKIQESVRAGHVRVNGVVQRKVSYVVRVGDVVSGHLLEAAAPMEALPEDLPLDVVHEDDFVMVVNKPPGMVVHPSAGHWRGTLVNAVLHHCRVPDAVPWPESTPACPSSLSSPSPSPSSSSSPSPNSSTPLPTLQPDTPWDLHVHGRPAHFPQLASDVKEVLGVLPSAGADWAGEPAHALPVDYRQQAVQNATSWPWDGDEDEEMEEGEDVEDDDEDVEDFDEFEIGEWAESSDAVEGRSLADGSAARACQSRGQPLVDVRGDVLRPGIVHRLDKGTSGLLVVAKEPLSQAHLSAQFKARTVRRRYVAILAGTPPAPQGIVNAAIGRDPRDRKRMAVLPPPRPSAAASAPPSRPGAKDSGGARRGPRSRHAVSRYEVVRVLCGGAASLVHWQLRTGRTHQIRVHARHIGAPVLGDATYGGVGGAAFDRLMRSIPTGRRGAMQQLLKSQLLRPCLHAATLGFVHPRTGEDLHFEKEPPADFALVLQHLVKLSP